MMLKSVPDGVPVLAVVVSALVATMAVLGWALIPILLQVVTLGL
jgi:hypothetical protein